MKICISYLIITLLTAYNSNAFGQKKLELILTDSTSRIIYQSKYSDKTELKQALHSKLQEFIQDGYFTTYISDSVWNKDVFSIKLNLGRKFEGIELINGNIQEERVIDIIRKSKKLNINELNQFFKAIITEYENIGFPFAEVGLDSFKFERNSAYAKVFVQKKSAILIDSIIIVGNAKLSNRFLENYLDIKTQSTYNEQKITQIDKLLQQLSFIDFVKPSEIIFTGEKARINIFINQKNSNQFDGIIGFQQSNNSTKLQFTGDFKLNLQNSFKRGESLFFNYKGLPNQTQNLIANVNLPYILFSKIGIDFNFQFFKRDSSFLNNNLKFDFVIPLATNKNLTLYFENFKSNLIAKNNETNVADIKSAYYGIGTDFHQLDNFNYPQKGYSLKFTLGLGKRNVLSVGNVDNSNIQIKSQLLNRIYIKYSSRLNFYFSQNGSYLSGNNLFENEIFRIGGFNTLRGFLEQSILANSYLINTSEIRYFIERKSYLFIFQDQSFIKFKTGEERKFKYPYGFGLGINLESKLGMIGINYGLGKQQNIPLNLQRGNIHFGLVSNF